MFGRRALLAPLLAASVLSASINCGGDDGGARDLHQDLNSGETSEMASSPEFQAARERLVQCLGDAGYVKDAHGKITLSDGSTYPPGNTDRIESTSAIVDYQIENERCLHESGLADVLQAYGRADPTPDSGRAKQHNDEVVRLMQCMEGKGWEIPEPRTLRGFLYFDTAQPAERQAAWDVDSAACSQELYGSGTGSP